MLLTSCCNMHMLLNNTYLHSYMYGIRMNWNRDPDGTYYQTRFGVLPTSAYYLILNISAAAIYGPHLFYTFLVVNLHDLWSKATVGVNLNHSHYCIVYILCLQKVVFTYICFILFISISICGFRVS